jgi:hypothetical protein
MATRTAALAPSNNTDALFRLWINEIHNALIAFGWTQASDTGQINFSTATRPTNVNLYQGYAIYKMGDALQATSPVYMRIDFGTGGVSDDPGIKVQLSIGATDGAGNFFSGVLSTIVTTSNANAAGSATLGTCRSSGSSSSFRMNFWMASGAGVAHGWAFAIERDKDSSGADTALGVCFAWVYMGNNVGTAVGLGSQFIGTDGTVGPVDTVRLYAMVATTAQQSAGSSKMCGPVHCWAGVFRNAMLGLLITSRPDWVSESINSVFIYGAIHTYLFLRTTNNNGMALNAWNADCGMALLWE